MIIAFSARSEFHGSEYFSNSEKCNTSLRGSVTKMTISNKRKELKCKGYGYRLWFQILTK